MNVLFLTTSYPRFIQTKRDFAINIHNLARELGKKCDSITVLAPHDNDTSNLKIVDNVEIHRFQYWFTKNTQKVAYNSGIYDNLKYSVLAKLQLSFFIISFLIKSIILSKGKDVIHAHWSLPGLLAVFVKKIVGIPVYLTFRGTGLAKSPRWLLKFICNNVDVVNVDDFVRTEMVESLGTNVKLSNVKLKYLDSNRYNSKISGNRIQKEFNLKNKKVITNAGRIIPVKDIHVYIKAAYILTKKTNYNFKFLIVGDGVLLPALKQLAKKLNIYDNIIFLGDRKDINEIYAASDAVVITESNQICFSNIILESMAIGTPCIIPKMRDSVEYWSDRENCIFYEAKNSLDLSKSIQLLFDDQKLYEKIHLNSLEWNEVQGFTKSDVVDRTFKFYDKLVIRR